MKSITFVFALAVVAPFSVQADWSPAGALAEQFEKASLPEDVRSVEGRYGGRCYSDAIDARTNDDKFTPRLAALLIETRSDVLGSERTRLMVDFFGYYRGSMTHYYTAGEVRADWAEASVREMFQDATHSDVAVCGSALCSTSEKRNTRWYIRKQGDLFFARIERGHYGSAPRYCVFQKAIAKPLPPEPPKSTPRQPEPRRGS